jgi:hypothetical protein
VLPSYDAESEAKIFFPGLFSEIQSTMSSDKYLVRYCDLRKSSAIAESLAKLRHWLESPPGDADWITLQINLKNLFPHFHSAVERRSTKHSISISMNFKFASSG